MIDINLLTSKDLLTVSQKLLRKNLAIVASILTLVIISSSTIVLVVDQLSTNRLSEIKSHRQELQNQFSNDLPKLEMIISLKDKLTGIKRVMTVRPSLSFAITKQQEMLPSGIKTSILNVASDGSIKFDIVVPNHKVLADYLNKLESDQENNFFKNIKISSVQMAKDGSFAFSVSANFKI